MRNPLSSEIEEAKTYIRSRMRVEESMRNNLEALMEKATKEMVAIAYRYKVDVAHFRFSINHKMQKEINDVISRLKQDLEYYTIRYSKEAIGGDKELLEAYLRSELYGKTFFERNNIYCNRFKYEIEAGIAAALILKQTSQVAIDNIISNLNHPYENQLIREVLKRGDGNATRLLTKGISYGVGRTNSMFKALSSLTQNTISSTWMYNWGETHISPTTTGFYSYRGSTYPCALCDDMAKRFHSISEYQGMWHPYCKCYFVFV